MNLCFCSPFLTVLTAWLAAISPLSAGTLAVFHIIPLNQDIEVELLDHQKPVTVKNFTRYVQTGAYSNMFLHRCMSNFVVQGGGFVVADRNAISSFSQAYYTPDYGTITNEFLVGPRVSNTYGTIAMAKLGSDPNSASSQWFFNLADNSSNLDNQNGGFTVFGRVVRGTNVLETFRVRNKNYPVMQGTVDLRAWYGSTDFANTFSDLPVNYLGAWKYPNYNDLFYADISLLTTQFSRTNQANRITWTSVSGRPNLIEVCTNSPPAWQTLLTTNGTGAVFSFTDTNTASRVRLYRVRVDY